MLSWLQPRTGLIFQSSNEGLEPGAVWLFLGCYSIPPHITAEGWNFGILTSEKKGHGFGWEKSLGEVGLPACFGRFLRVMSCQVRSVSIFHAAHAHFLNSCYQC